MRTSSCGKTVRYTAYGIRHTVQTAACLEAGPSRTPPVLASRKRFFDSRARTETTSLTSEVVVGDASVLTGGAWCDTYAVCRIPHQHALNHRTTRLLRLVQDLDQCPQRMIETLPVPHRTEAQTYRVGVGQSTPRRNRLPVPPRPLPIRACETKSDAHQGSGRVSHPWGLAACAR